MDALEKNMLIGAFSTGLVDLGLEAYYAYAEGKGETGLRDQFPYQEISPYIPPVDDWIACAGIPALVYALGKLMKKPQLVEIAKGGAIYGVSELAGQTMFRIVIQLQSQAGAARYMVVGAPVVR